MTFIETSVALDTEEWIKKKHVSLHFASFWVQAAKQLAAKQLAAWLLNTHFYTSK